MISVSLLVWRDGIIIFVKITFQVFSDILVSVLTEHNEMDGEK
jgi:hypothetical protein